MKYTDEKAEIRKVDSIAHRLRSQTLDEGRFKLFNLVMKHRNKITGKTKEIKVKNLAQHHQRHHILDDG